MIVYETVVRLGSLVERISAVVNCAVPGLIGVEHVMVKESEAPPESDMIGISPLMEAHPLSGEASGTERKPVPLLVTVTVAELLEPGGA